MAKFRNGNLVLTSAQTIIQGSSTVLDATRKGTFNSLDLDSAGAVITEFSIDGTLAGSSDTVLPTEKAVKSYVDAGLAGLSQNKISQLDSKVEVTDTGSNGLIVFHTDGAEKVRISSSGNVGINFNNPNHKLQVLGEVGLYNSGTDGALGDSLFFGNSSYPTTYRNKIKNSVSSTPANSKMTFSLSTGTTTYFDSLTMLGSGESSFSSNLNIAGTTKTAGYLYAGATDPTNNNRLNYDGYFYSTALIAAGFLAVTGTTKNAGFFYAGTTDPTNTTRLNYDGYFYATRVYNAVWNDIADFQDLIDDLIPGKCYYDTDNGAKICNLKCQKSVIGIASDTYGYGIGQSSDKKQVPISVCGWVLAYVNGNCNIGDVLTSDFDGNLIKMTDEEKCKFPERIVAIYKKAEHNEYFGTKDNKIEVKGRHWVKVK